MPSTSVIMSMYLDIEQQFTKSAPWVADMWWWGRLRGGFCEPINWKSSGLEMSRSLILNFNVFQEPLVIYQYAL